MCVCRAPVQRSAVAWQERPGSAVPYKEDIRGSFAEAHDDFLTEYLLSGKLSLYNFNTINHQSANRTALLHIGLPQRETIAIDRAYSNFHDIVGIPTFRRRVRVRHSRTCIPRWLSILRVI